jgi:LPXTG-site transpeptidase (sortase) family protein
MISYTKTNVNLISFIISVILFFSLNIIYSFAVQIDSINTSNSVETEEINQEVSINNEINEKENTNNKEENNTKETNTVEAKKENTAKTEWKIEIEAISLSAQIAEGTTDQVMNKYVGHFETTSKKKGNIGLAAHNRGYPVNYFENLKKLKQGDEIKYTYGKFKKTYVVNKIEIIEDTDWSALEDSEDNIITLITCVENEPNYRRCIQGIEK